MVIFIVMLVYQRMTIEIVDLPIKNAGYVHREIMYVCHTVPNGPNDKPNHFYGSVLSPTGLLKAAQVS